MIKHTLSSIQVVTRSSLEILDICQTRVPSIVPKVGQPTPAATHSEIFWHIIESQIYELGLTEQRQGGPRINDDVFGA